LFLGHFGVAFGAKRYAPAAGLGALFMAAQFVDLLWPVLLLLGLERVAIVPGITVVTPLDFQHYPISHSLVAAFGWAALLGGSYYAMFRSTRAAWVIAMLVASHWFLDLVVHRPDLPLIPGNDTRVGLGLWSSLPATLAVELAMLGIGAWIYSRTTRARDGVGRWAFAGLLAFLLVIEAANLFGPPPPSVQAIAWAGQAQWLIVLWAFWVDRHREVAVPRLA
jgi:hypothetical protein